MPVTVAAALVEVIAASVRIVALASLPVFTKLLSASRISTFGVALPVKK